MEDDLTDITFQAENSAEDARSESHSARDKQPLHGPLATSILAHGGGIGLGIAGLLVGAFVASPLVAVAALLGGIAAGTLFLDHGNSRTNSLAQSADITPGQSLPGEDGPIVADAAIAQSQAPRQITGTPREGVSLPIAGGISFDAAFDERQDVNPSPAGNRQAPRRKTI
jgi:hypothetical protein